MYIHAAEHFIAEPFADPGTYQGELKKLTDFYLRRTNKFIMLALLGAHACVKGHPFPDDMPVYFATENGNLHDTEIVLGQIYRAHSFPKPINFINTMSNVAAFYIAQSMKITGRNIMVSGKHLSFERALQLMQSEFVSGTARTGLVGSVDEAVFSRELFESRFGAASSGVRLVEASGWLLLSTEEQGAIGSIDAVKSFTGADEAREWLAGQEGLSECAVSFGMLISGSEKDEWKKLFPRGEFDHISMLGYNDSIAPCGLSSFLKKTGGPDRLMAVNRDREGRHVIVSVRAF
ncbi:MAG TPA: hypothetical protein PK926_10620 [Spirochaetota bacterium]|nr:hypothetical protein [Spirochaetota bacterium]HPR47285.1 hypothetical protein [Spirochaetota bacterium]